MSDKNIQVSAELELTPDQYTRLKKRVGSRLKFGSQLRDMRVSVYEAMDRYLNGHLQLDQDDRRRVRDNLRGLGHKPVDTNTSFALFHIDDLVGYTLDLLFPPGGVYTALSDNENQAVAQSLARRMNRDAAFFQHIFEYEKGLFNGYKYNFMAILLEWEVKEGKIPDTSGTNTQGPVPFIDGVLHAGNCITSLDPYNFLYDESVELRHLSAKGEFFAMVEAKTRFNVDSMFDNEEIWGQDRLFNAMGEKIQPINVTETATAKGLFRAKPDIARQILTLEDGSSRQNDDWFSVLSAHTASGEDSIELYELTNCYIWLPGQKYGLIPEAAEGEPQVKGTQLYRVTLLADEIVAVQALDNYHQMLPIAACAPIEDDLKHQTRSIGERLLPAQSFMSHEINVHQRAQRRALYGVNVYDAGKIPDPRAIDLSSGWVPAKNLRQGGLRDAVHQLDTPSYKKDTNVNLELGFALLESVMPTTKPQMVADLNRATKYQAAQLHQTSSRRPYKFSLLINVAMVEPSKRLQFYNLLQYGTEAELIDDNGEIVSFNPVNLIGKQIEFDISDGLKGIDQLLMITAYDELIMTMLQSPQFSNGQVDMISLIDYVTTLHGDKTSFKQFKAPSPLTNMPPQMQQIAFQIFQQWAQTEEGQQAIAQIEAGGQAPIVGPPPNPNEEA